MVLNRIAPTVLSLVACLFFTNCNRPSSTPPLVAIDQVPGTVENAFKDANPDAKSSAHEIAVAVEGKDNAKALFDLQKLFDRPDLTPEQREAASRSMLSVNAQLRAAAAQGDRRAEEALQNYRASK